MVGAPDLSVVLATAHPGAALDLLLQRLLPQLATVRGELIFVDGSQAGLPAPEHDDVALTHLRRAGADVFSMRADGLKAARGWVVTFAEDHCMPADDHWAMEVLEAHRQFGSVAAVTGAIRNGTPGTPWDRGSYLLTFAAVSEPLALGLWTSPAPPPPANLSIKREVLDAFAPVPGFVEFELLPHLARTGHLAVAPAVRMEHHQSHTLRWFMVHHFHNGRTTGGLAPGTARGDRLRRVADAVRFPPRHLRHLLATLRSQPGGARAHGWAMPIATLLLTAHAAGQLCGILTGAGRSPAALE